MLAELCRPIVDADDVFTEPASIRKLAERLVVSWDASGTARLAGRVHVAGDTAVVLD